MDYLFSLVEHYGLLLVFANVLIGQLGMPLPSYPTLVMAGALVAHGQYSVCALLLTAVAAALVADFTWYLAGLRFGEKVTLTLCRISFSPDSCMRQTQRINLRWGAVSLLVAKFVPGFAAIAGALGGAVGIPVHLFLLFDVIGATLWAGSAILFGTHFGVATERLLALLEGLGKWGGILVSVALFGFFVLKWRQRQRVLKSFEQARLNVDELHQMLQAEKLPFILDVRSSVLPGTPRIPRAVVLTTADLSSLPFNENDDEVVIYCSCPCEAAAAVAARKIMDRGYKRVRTLAGGIEAWKAASYRVEI